MDSNRVIKYETYNYFFNMLMNSIWFTQVLNNFMKHIATFSRCLWILSVIKYETYSCFLKMFMDIVCLHGFS